MSASDALNQDAAADNADATKLEKILSREKTFGIAATDGIFGFLKIVVPFVPYLQVFSDEIEIALGAGQSAIDASLAAQGVILPQPAVVAVEGLVREGTDALVQKALAQILSPEAAAAAAPALQKIAGTAATAIIDGRASQFAPEPRL